jgi:chemotaxis methyl-accepting protein methylase
MTLHQYPAEQQQNLKPAYSANRSAEQHHNNLKELLHSGIIEDRSLNRKVAKLRDRFATYCSLYPHGLWAPGLVITNAMRAQTELYLPITEIQRAFTRFFSLALLFPATETTHFPTHTTWLDLLHRLRDAEPSPDPARLLERLSTDAQYRIRFLFTLFLPRHHGGGFNRYPGQQTFLAHWFTEIHKHTNRTLRCLDAACGTGEGTYDLALLAQDRGVNPANCHIAGCSIDPFELFAAAHGTFPHDLRREGEYQQKTAALFATGQAKHISFFRDDIARFPNSAEKPYDLILCNGLLGGPVLHNEVALGTAIAALAARLNAGGLLLVADHFHAGWKKQTPPQRFIELLHQADFMVRNLDDGFAAIKKERNR